jgi:hypothetical protein
MNIFQISSNFGPKSKKFEFWVGLVKKPSHATVPLRFTRKTFWGTQIQYVLVNNKVYKQYNTAKKKPIF